MVAMDAGLPPPFQFRCPDVASALAQCENQLVRADAGTEDGLVHLVACTMEMSDVSKGNTACRRPANTRLETRYLFHRHRGCEHQCTNRCSTGFLKRKKFLL